MNKLIPIMSVLCAFAVAATNAQEASKPAELKRIPAQNSESTNVKAGDPVPTESVIPELQGIVVLCATEPQSAEFKQQWAAYVRGNYKPGMDIDTVIKDVLRRADEYKAGKRGGSKGPETKVLQSTYDTERMMHDMAMSVIKNIRS